MPPQPGMHDPCKVFCDPSTTADVLIGEFPVGRPLYRLAAAKNPHLRGLSLTIPIRPYNQIANFIGDNIETGVEETFAAVVNATGAEWGWPVVVIEHGQFSQNVPHGHLQIGSAAGLEDNLTNHVVRRIASDRLPMPKVFEGSMTDFAKGGALAKIDLALGYLAVGQYYGPVAGTLSMHFYDPSACGAGNRRPGFLREITANAVGRPHLAKSARDKIPAEHHAIIDAWTADTLHSLRLRPG